MPLLVTHHCLTDPDADFPSGLPDVGPAGTTWDDRRNVIGPWFHACRTCGERYQWHEQVGFVAWFSVDPDRTAREARIAAAAPSEAEKGRPW